MVFCAEGKIYFHATEKGILWSLVRAVSGSSVRRNEKCIYILLISMEKDHTIPIVRRKLNFTFGSIKI